VPGRVRADVLVRRVLERPALVADLGLRHALELAKRRLDAPEATCSERSSLLHLLLLQFECRRVDAVALPGRRGAVREDVAEVAAAVGAHDLGANHAEGRVSLLVDRLLARRRVERGPAAAGVVL